MRGLRLTAFGKVLAVLVVATVVLSIVAPGAGLIAAIVLAVIGLCALADGFMGGGFADGSREQWAKVDVDRKRDALRRGRR